MADRVPVIDVINPVAEKVSYEIHKGDITDKESLRAPMTGVDGVYHIAAWYEIGFPLEEAVTSLTIVTVLGPGDPTVRANALAAREILERLGARPLVERLDAVLNRAVEPASTTVPVAEPPGPLATDALAAS